MSSFLPSGSPRPHQTFRPRFCPSFSANTQLFLPDNTGSARPLLPASVISKPPSPPSAMADNPFESMLPYQQTSAYKTRVLEVARLMMEHQRGITLPQVTNKMRQIMEINIKQLFEERRSPDLVGSKLLYLSTWRECLKLYNPGKSEFPRPPSILGRCLPILSLPRRGPQFPLGRRARVRVDGPVGVPSRPLDRVQSIPRSPDPRGTSTRRQSGVAGYQEQGRRASSASGRDTAQGQQHPTAHRQPTWPIHNSCISGRQQE